MDADPLSRRERQLLDILYARGPLSAADVRAALPDPPSYSAVRALLRILEDKGHASHDADSSGRYVYRASRPRNAAARGALKQLLRTFFDNSPSRAVATLLSDRDLNLTGDELDELSRLIADARANNANKMADEA